MFFSVSIVSFYPHNCIHRSTCKKMCCFYIRTAEEIDNMLHILCGQMIISCVRWKRFEKHSCIVENMSLSMMKKTVLQWMFLPKREKIHQHERKIDDFQTNAADCIELNTSGIHILLLLSSIWIFTSCWIATRKVLAPQRWSLFDREINYWNCRQKNIHTDTHMCMWIIAHRRRTYFILYLLTTESNIHNVCI